MPAVSRMHAHDLARELALFAKQQGLEPQQAYFIRGEFSLTDASGNSVYSDEAHLWCYDCAKALLKKAKALMPTREHENHRVCSTEADGEDTRPQCQDCGAVLEGTVSEYCVDEDTRYYLANPISQSSDVNAHQAVAISQILYSAAEDRRVLKIGRSAVTAVRHAVKTSIQSR